MHVPFRYILIFAMFNLILQENYIKAESSEVEEAILTMNDRQALVSAAMHIICVRNIIFWKHWSMTRCGLVERDGNLSVVQPFVKQMCTITQKMPNTTLFLEQTFYSVPSASSLLSLVPFQLQHVRTKSIYTRTNTPDFLEGTKFHSSNIIGGKNNDVIHLSYTFQDFKKWQIVTVSATQLRERNWAH